MHLILFVSVQMLLTDLRILYLRQALIIAYPCAEQDVQGVPEQPPFISYVHIYMSKSYSTFFIGI